MRGVMRKKRVIQPGMCCHLVSRVAHRAYFLDDEEKSRFVDLLRRVEFFCCVRVLAYCCMSNHIHVFMHLEEERELSEDEILARVTALYRGSRLEGALGEMARLHRAAIRARLGEIDAAVAGGGIVDRLFGMFGSGKGKKAERERKTQGAPSGLAGDCPVPPRRALELEEGNGETAARLLAFLASGAKSRSEIAAELGISSQPWLSRAYLSPLMERGYIAQTLPRKPRSPLQRYRLSRKGRFDVA